MEGRDDPTYYITGPGGVVIIFAGLGVASELPPYLGIPVAMTFTSLGAYLAGASFYYGLGLDRKEVRKALRDSVRNTLRKIRNCLYK